MVFVPGRLAVSFSYSEGKVQLVQNLLKTYIITWDDVIVVGDDRNNIEIMEHAKASIGFNAYYPVRKMAKYLVDSNDLRGVLDFITLRTDQRLINSARV